MFLRVDSSIFLIASSLKVKFIILSNILSNREIETEEAQIWKYGKEILKGLEQQELVEKELRKIIKLTLIHTSLQRKPVAFWLLNWVRLKISEIISSSSTTTQMDLLRFISNL